MCTKGSGTNSLIRPPRFCKPRNLSQMMGPVPWVIHVPEHDCGSGWQSKLVRRGDDIEPLPGGDLVGANLITHLVVQDLGGRSRQSAQARVTESDQVLANINAEGFCPMPDLKRRERVNMEIRHCLTDCSTDFEIGFAAVSRMNTALHADFRRSAFPGLERATHDFFNFQIVGPATQIPGVLAL